MKQNVYAVYDVAETKLYQFAALETVLAKDAVLAFAQENGATLFGLEFESSDVFRDFMTAISATSSIEELTVVLNDWDFFFNIIQIS